MSYVSIMDIVRAHAPFRGDLVALVSSFADGSSGAGISIVGGYIFKKSKIPIFEKRWRLMLKRFDLVYFHMTECNAQKGTFRHLGNRCDQVAREAIDIICDTAEMGVYVGMKDADYHKTVPPKSFHHSPYSFLLSAYLMACRECFDVVNPKGLVSYFFETGDDGGREAALTMSVMMENERIRKLFRYRSHGFLEKTYSLPTQAADLLAWQALKHYRRLENGHKSMRGDFAALHARIPHRFLMHDEVLLRRLVKQINDNAGGPGGVYLMGDALHQVNPKSLRNPLVGERLVKEGRR